MQGGKKSHMTRRGRRFLALGVLMGAALAAVAVAQGGGLGIAGLGSGPSGYVGKGGKMVGKGHGFGEAYKAPSATLSHALFSAKLIPGAKAPRNISLAALGRSTKKVNYSLALKCWMRTPAWVTVAESMG